MVEYKTHEITCIGQKKAWQKNSHGELGMWENRWVLCCPACGMIATLTNHKVNVINGKATISPSLRCPYDACGAHYFVKNGKVE